MKRKPNHGLTLIELLVSIGIIALLITLLLPGFKSVMANAKKVSCLNNLRQLSVAFIQYRTDHQQLFPGEGASNDSTGRWMQKVSTYLGIPPSTVANNNIAYYQPVFYCSMVPAWIYRPGSSKAGYGVYGAPRTIVPLEMENGISYLQIIKPSTKVLLADKNYQGYIIGTGAGPGLDITAPYPQQADGPAANHRPDGKTTAGPDGACNYLFCDGHAETLVKWPGVTAYDPYH